jgi:hypothetical protein
MPWGQGDTQIEDILQLMKKENYGFVAAAISEAQPD